MTINVVLAVFNLIPIPPLDGSKIVFNLFKVNAHTQHSLERFGPMILLGIILLGSISGFSLFSIVLSPFIGIFYFIFGG
jgi:Zn-dependent protease